MSRLKDIFKEKSSANLFCNIAIILCFIIAIVIIIFPPYKLSSDNFELKNQNFIGKIRNNDVLEQEVLLDKKYNGVGFFAATYAETLTKGNISIEICNNKNKCKTIKKDSSTILDNSYFYISYNFKKNTPYKIKITCNNMKKPITFYTTEAEIANASLKLNGTDLNKSLEMAFTYKVNNYFPVWYCLLLACLIYCFKIFIGGKINEK